MVELDNDKVYPLPIECYKKAVTYRYTWKNLDRVRCRTVIDYHNLCVSLWFCNVIKRYSCVDLSTLTQGTVMLIIHRSHIQHIRDWKGRKGRGRVPMNSLSLSSNP